MDKTVESTADLIKNPVFWMILAWGVREVFGWFRSSMKHKDENFAVALKENSHEIAKLNNTLIKLETKFEPLEKFVYAIPKIQQDINHLWQKVRGHEQAEEI